MWKSSIATSCAAAVCLAASLLHHQVVCAGEPPVPARRVFITSTTGTGDLSTWADAGGNSGLAAADAVCQARAAAAMLADPQDYIAWMSDSTTDAYCRVHGAAGTKAGNCGGLPALPAFAGPWLRPDDQPFAEAISLALNPESRIYLPALLDETGTEAAHAIVMTATDRDGVYRAEESAACSDWTSAAAEQVAVGSGLRTAESWTHFGRGNCNQLRALMCVQTGEGAALPAISGSGGLAFVTSENGTANLGAWPDAGGLQGVDAADHICRSRATAAALPLPGSFKAWISVNGADAADRYSFDGPWMRPDGVEIAQSKADLLDGRLFGPINQTELGAYIANHYAWTGTGDDGSWAGADCSGWTSGEASATGVPGVANAVDDWTDFGLVVPCHYGGRLYCLADIDSSTVIFGDDFESGDTDAWSATQP